MEIKNILTYLLIIVATIVITGMIVPKIDFLKNKEIKVLELNIERLKEERTQYIKEASKYKKSSEQYQKEFNRLDSLNQQNEKEIEYRNKYINIMKNKLDSLDIKINVSDSLIIKLDKEEYEIRNNSNNNTINEYKKFFTNRFKTKNNN